MGYFAGMSVSWILLFASFVFMVLTNMRSTKTPIDAPVKSHYLGRGEVGKGCWYGFTYSKSASSSIKSLLRLLGTSLFCVSFLGIPGIVGVTGFLSMCLISLGKIFNILTDGVSRGYYSFSLESKYEMSMLDCVKKYDDVLLLNKVLKNDESALPGLLSLASRKGIGFTDLCDVEGLITREGVISPSAYSMLESNDYSKKYIVAPLKPKVAVPVLDSGGVTIGHRVVEKPVEKPVENSSSDDQIIRKSALTRIDKVIEDYVNKKSDIDFILANPAFDTMKDEKSREFTQVYMTVQDVDLSKMSTDALVKLSVQLREKFDASVAGAERLGTNGYGEFKKEGERALKSFRQAQDVGPDSGDYDKAMATVKAMLDVMGIVLSVESARELQRHVSKSITAQ